MSIRTSVTQTQLCLNPDGDSITMLAHKSGEEDTFYTVSVFHAGKEFSIRPSLEELLKLHQQLETIIGA